MMENDKMMERNNQTGAFESKTLDALRTQLLSASDDTYGCMVDLSDEKCIRIGLDREMEALTYSMDVLNKNICPAALLAPSQTGKSTTTAAMADGREVTPCGRAGGGTRTSSVPITLYHAPDKGIEIDVYSKEELAEQVMEVVSLYLDPKKKTYDLEIDEDYELLLGALEKEIERYQKSESCNYDERSKDLLRRAILIMAYYHSEAHQELRDGEFNTIDKLQPFLSFNVNNEKNWEGMKEKGFDIVYDLDENGNMRFGELESLHVFIKGISIPLNSEFMRETKTAVIDPPGTMMTIEDTRRALKAASEAAVVLMIVSSEKQPTQTDKEFLRTLYSADLAEKVVVAVNLHRPQRIFEENGLSGAWLAALEEAGYQAPHHKKLLYYNAYLAMRVEQGKLLLRGELDNLTQKGIIEDAEKRRGKEFKNVEDAWVYTTKRALSQMEAEDEEDELKDNGLCESVLAQIEKVSGWREMIGALREHVMNNRAAGMLLDLGARPAQKAISVMDNRLKWCEQVATESVETAEKEYQEAKTLLDEFSKRAGDVINENFQHNGRGHHAIDKALAENYFSNVMMDAVEPMAEQAAEKIYNAYKLSNHLKVLAAKGVDFLKGAVNMIGKVFVDHDVIDRPEVQSVKKMCENIVNESMNREMMALGCAWMNDLNENDVYQEFVVKRVKSVQKRFGEIRDQLKLNKNTLLRELDIVPDEMTGDFARDVQNCKEMINHLQAEKNIQVHLSPEVIALLGGSIALVGMVIWFPGLGYIAGLLVYAIYELIYLFAEGGQNEAINKIKMELIKTAHEGFLEKKDELIAEVIEGEKGKPGIKAIREFYKTAFYAVMADQKKALKREHDDKITILNTAAEQKKEIAEFAAQFRKERIQPLSNQIEDVVKQIEKLRTDK